jgi:uridine kinase
MKDNILIAIVGMSGSGKSIATDYLVKSFSCLIFVE